MSSKRKKNARAAASAGTEENLLDVLTNDELFVEKGFLDATSEHKFVEYLRRQAAAQTTTEFVNRFVEMEQLMVPKRLEEYVRRWRTVNNRPCVIQEHHLCNINSDFCGVERIVENIYGCKYSGIIHVCKMSMQSCRRVFVNGSSELICVLSNTMIGAMIADTNYAALPTRNKYFEDPVPRNNLQIECRKLPIVSNKPEAIESRRRFVEDNMKLFCSRRINIANDRAVAGLFSRAPAPAGAVSLPGNHLFSPSTATHATDGSDSNSTSITSSTTPTAGSPALSGAANIFDSFSSTPGFRSGSAGSIFSPKPTLISKKALGSHLKSQERRFGRALAAGKSTASSVKSDGSGESGVPSQTQSQRPPSLSIAVRNRAASVASTDLQRMTFGSTSELLSPSTTTEMIVFTPTNGLVHVSSRSASDAQAGADASSHTVMPIVYDVRDERVLMEQIDAIIDILYDPETLRDYNRSRLDIAMKHTLHSSKQQYRSLGDVGSAVLFSVEESLSNVASAGTLPRVDIAVIRRIWSANVAAVVNMVMHLSQKYSIQNRHVGQDLSSFVLTVLYLMRTGLVHNGTACIPKCEVLEQTLPGENHLHMFLQLVNFLAQRSTNVRQPDPVKRINMCTSVIRHVLDVAVARDASKEDLTLFTYTKNNTVTLAPTGVVPAPLAPVTRNARFISLLDQLERDGAPAAPVLAVPLVPLMDIYTRSQASVRTAHDGGAEDAASHMELMEKIVQNTFAFNECNVERRGADVDIDTLGEAMDLDG